MTPARRVVTLLTESAAAAPRGRDDEGERRRGRALGEPTTQKGAIAGHCHRADNLTPKRILRLGQRGRFPTDAIGPHRVSVARDPTAESRPQLDGADGSGGSTEDEAEKGHLGAGSRCRLFLAAAQRARR